MKKQLNEKQQAEAAFICQWCLSIIEFIYPPEGQFAEMTAQFKAVFSKETELRYLEKTTPGIYIKGMRMAFRDLNEMAQETPADILTRINQTLRNKFGKDLTTYARSTQAQVKKIIKRGKITTDEEYQLLETRVSDLCQMDPRPDGIDVLNELLGKYYSRLTDHNLH